MIYVNYWFYLMCFGFYALDFDRLYIHTHMLDAFISARMFTLRPECIQFCSPPLFRSPIALVGEHLITEPLFNRTPNTPQPADGTSPKLGRKVEEA